jgi:hypothetical protein
VSTSRSGGIAISPRARDDGTGDVVGDPEAAVEDDDVGLRERPIDAEVADLRIGERGFELVGIGARIVAPRQERREAFADGHDGTRRVLDDPERGKAGREELERAEEREMPRLLDDDEAEPEHSRKQCARHRGHAPDHEREHDRQSAEHRELRLADRLVVLREERAGESGHRGRKHEHGDLGFEHVDADSGRRGLAVAERDEAPAERAAPERDHPDADESEHGSDEQQEGPRPVEVHAEQ